MHINFQVEQWVIYNWVREYLDKLTFNFDMETWSEAWILCTLDKVSKYYRYKRKKSTIVNVSFNFLQAKYGNLCNVGGGSFLFRDDVNDNNKKNPWSISKKKEYSSGRPKKKNNEENAMGGWRGIPTTTIKRYQQKKQRKL